MSRHEQCQEQRAFKTPRQVTIYFPNSCCMNVGVYRRDVTSVRFCLFVPFCRVLVFSLCFFLDACVHVIWMGMHVRNITPAPRGANLQTPTCEGEEVFFNLKGRMVVENHYCGVQRCF